jgi:hypothetical protein
MSLLVEQLQQWCMQGISLTYDMLETQHAQIIKKLEGRLGDQLKLTQNMMHFQDYALRVGMLNFFIHFSQANYSNDLWRNINDHFEAVDIISLESAFLFLALSALVQTFKRGKGEQTE